MSDKRKALRTLPAYDPDNNIGAVDRVRFAMINNRMDALHEDELQQFERWKQIDDWVRERRSPTHRALRNAVMAKYEISWDTAERDIKNTKDLFKASNDDNEYYRSVYIEDIESKAAKAYESEDFGSYAKLMDIVSKLRGLFDDKPEVVDYDKLQSFQIVMDYNPEAMGLTRIENVDEVMSRWMQKKTISQTMQKNAEDAEFE